MGDVWALLTAGANPNLAMMVAALYGQAEIFSLLIDAGGALTGPENPGTRFLYDALYSSNKKVREKRAKEQEQRLAEGKTAFQDGGGYNEIIKILLEHGVPADSPDELGVTPLMIASMSGNEVAAGLFLEHGASADTENKTDGTTALQHAAWGGHGKIVELLLKAGASPDKADSNKTTSLLQAAVQAAARPPSSSWAPERRRTWRPSTTSTGRTTCRPCAPCSRRGPIRIFPTGWTSRPS